MSNPPNDAAVPSSAMDTGSEAGTPGPAFPDDPPGPDELQLLAELERPGPAVVPDPVEAAPEVVEAVSDDSPLPGAPSGEQDDGLAPRFREPGAG